MSKYAISIYDIEDIHNHKLLKEMEMEASEKDDAVDPLIILLLMDA